MGRVESAAACLASLLSVLVCGCGQTGQPAVPRAGGTDVLLVTVCTLRPDHLGAYGYPRPTSPVIDGLAERGVVFEQVLAPAPWTRPSIAAQISGLHPRALDLQERAAAVNNRGLGPEVETLAETLRRAGYRTLGVTANPNVNAVFRFDQGYEVYEDTGALWREGYAQRKWSAGEVVARFLAALDAGASQLPFFAHLVLVDTHLPYRNDTRRAAGIRPEELGVYGDPRQLAYDLQVRYVDRTLGALLEALRERDRSDLLVVVTSDHGEGFQEHRADDRVHGHHLYDSTIWLPWILWHRGLGPGRVSAVVSGADLTPTLLDLLGLEAPPPAAAPALRGRSLAGAVLGDAVAPARAGFVESAFEGVDKSAVVTDGWKLVVDWKAEPALRFQLVDRARDPHGFRDASADHPEIAAALREELRAFRASESAGVRAPVIDPDADLRRELEALGYLGGE